MNGHLLVFFGSLALIVALVALQVRCIVDPGPEQAGDDRVRRAIAGAIRESGKWQGTALRIVRSQS